MYDPLPARGHFFSLAALPFQIQIEDDVLADSPHALDPRALQNRSDLLRRRFQRLGLGAEPDRFDDVTRDALVQAAGDGFYLGKFGHKKQCTVICERPNPGKTSLGATADLRPSAPVCR